MLYTWEKHFLKEFFKLFFLFIFCFYGLYILIDFTSHSGSAYVQNGFSFKNLLLYYACEFIHRADVIVPFALLITTIRTLCALNINNELIALLAGGIKLKRLLRPFLLIGLSMTALMFVNVQYLQPYANSEINFLGHSHLKSKNKLPDIPSVQHLILEDGSNLLYHSYDETQHQFLDVYWVRSIHDIYHFKSLDPKARVPTGYYVDRLRRSEGDGGLHVTESKKMMLVSNMVFNKKTLMETITQPDDQSLTDLWKKISTHETWLSDKQAHVISVFYLKVATPWLCLLAVIGPAPFCLRFTRNLPVFYIYAFSIFVFVAFHLAFNAAVVLGKKQVIAPDFVILPTLLLFFCPVGIRYALIK